MMMKETHQFHCACWQYKTHHQTARVWRCAPACDTKQTEKRRDKQAGVPPPPSYVGVGFGGQKAHPVSRRHHYCRTKSAVEGCGVFVVSVARWEGEGDGEKNQRSRYTSSGVFVPRQGVGEWTKSVRNRMFFLQRTSQSAVLKL